MLPIVILFVTGLLTMFASFMPQRTLPKYLGMLGVLAAMVVIHLKLGIGIEFPQFFTMFPLTKIMTVLVLGLLFFIIFQHGKYESDYDWSAVVSLMLFSTCGVILLLGVRNLLTLFLGIEIMSIPLYVMAASKRHSASSLEAGIKYFILGSFASAFLLFGIALVYGTTGSFIMEEIIMVQQMRGAEIPAYFFVGFIFIILSLVFKMALAPFHFWSPDVYDGSPTFVTMFMTTIVKIGSSIAMYFILAGFFVYQFEIYFKFLLPIIVISFFVGAFAGLIQYNVKRMFAYSGITHIAFILSAIILGIALKDFSIFVFYLITYSIASILVFMVIDYLQNGNAVYLDHFNGLKKSQPILAVALAIAIFSMAGVPFTGGFIAKFKVLTGLYQLNKWVFAAALLSSAIAIAYYLGIVNRIFFYESSQENVAIRCKSLTIIVVILSIILILLGILPEHIPQVIHKFFVL